MKTKDAKEEEEVEEEEEEEEENGRRGGGDQKGKGYVGRGRTMRFLGYPCQHRFAVA